MKMIRVLLFFLVLATVQGSVHASNKNCEAPNALIILDQSGSMKSGSPSKWDQAKSAINLMLSNYGYPSANKPIRFALYLFPNPLSQYSADYYGTQSTKLSVEVGDDRRNEITKKLNKASPPSGGYTPITRAIEAIQNKSMLKQQGRRSFIIFITDGKESCGGTACSGNPSKVIKSIYNNYQAKTYVIGFGNGVDKSTLKDMAAAGQTGDYYKADNSNKISAVLDSIARDITTEICDGFDNDCDGKIDEGFSKGKACKAGMGLCERQGKIICSADGLTSFCNAVKGNPSKEICDGKDNDCDGKTDENFSVGDSCSVGVGACRRTGAKLCGASGKIECSVSPGKPSKEICDGIDNDCDGLKDEEFNLGATCKIGKGECRSSGFLVCGASGNSVCSATVIAPQNEICDGKDNDCDGKTDEGFDIGDSCTVGIGQCENSGIKVCSANRKTSVCNVNPKSPSSEVCDGVDNNCDGSVDEGFDLGQACSVGTGACTNNGTFICDGTGSAVCSANALNPGKEICDGVDNDCDGQIDEDYQLGLECSVGTGECNNSGKTICSANGKTTTCSVKPKASSKELCDGKDNDCDGDIDEGFNLGDACSVGKGQCLNNGVLICDSSLTSAICNVSPLATSKELCDGLDNDCDGDVDEGFDLGQSCEVGIGECLNKGVKVCGTDPAVSVCNVSANSPAKELCDGLDNDCDGDLDEDFNLGDLCEVGLGECLNKGVFVCNTAKTGTECDVSPLKASSELCDNLDNDCDGDIDEDFNVGDNCELGVGACKSSGNFICNTRLDGTECNAQPSSPSIEVCDAVDNDCDGLTDESIERKCSNACFDGKELCEMGKWLSCDAPAVPAEKCDGLDNNCDGFTDENVSCDEPGSICLCGECAMPCARGECPAGRVCNSIGYCVSDPCCGISCAANQICAAGSCLDSCSGISCKTEELCILGKCLERTCLNDPAFKCAQGEICNQGKCVLDTVGGNCNQLNCSKGQYCFEGSCRDLCENVSCQQGEKCEFGNCVKDDCQNKCPEGQYCDLGKCLPDPCLSISCPDGLSCLKGTCEETGCSRVNCPAGYVCKDKQCQKPKSQNSNSNGGSGSNSTNQTGSNTSSSSGSGQSNTGNNTSSGGSGASESNNGANDNSDSDNKNGAGTSDLGDGNAFEKEASEASSGDNSNNSVSDGRLEGISDGEGNSISVDASGCSLNQRQIQNQFSSFLLFLFILFSLRLRFSFGAFFGKRD